MKVDNRGILYQQQATAVHAAANSAVCTGGYRPSGGQAVQASVAAINRYLLPTRPTATNPQHAAVDQWDRETDGQMDGHPMVTEMVTPDGYILHTMWGASNSKNQHPINSLFSRTTWVSQ